MELNGNDQCSNGNEVNIKQTNDSTQQTDEENTEIILNDFVINFMGSFRGNRDICF